MSKEPLDEIQWKNPEWIQQFGLFTGNVLDYFSESPFYDRTSNNQVLRMQFQFQQIPPNINPQKYLQLKLVEMTGIEFIIAASREPDFWIIRKQTRLSPKQVNIEQDYYIIGANIYQAHKVYDILSSRLLSSVLSIKGSMELLNKMSKFNIHDMGHSYPTLQAEKEISSSSNTIPNTVSVNTTTPMLHTPATASNINSNGHSSTNLGLNNEILNLAFDNLLNNVINSSNDDTYLEDIPLYGKGSTVESLGVKVNLDDI